MRTTSTWILSGLLALAFFGAGLSKLSSQPMMIQEFDLFGLPRWFMYLTGLIEVGSAALVLVPRLASIGAALLVCTMVGAILAHVTHGQAAMIAVPVVLLLLALAVGTLRGWGRDARLTARPI